MESLYLNVIGPLHGYLMVHVLGGPRPLQTRYVINAQKESTLFVMLAVMFHYGNFSMPAYLYLASTLDKN